MKLTSFVIVAFSATGACSIASALADPDFIITESATTDTVSAPIDVVTETAPPSAVDLWQRLQWFDERTFGVSNLGGSIPGAAWMTLLDRPHEAGTHFEGFAERYDVSISTNALSNAMESGLGAIWGEDPRYLRDGPSFSFKSRFGHVVKWAVVAPNGNGELRPAYARFIALTGSSFISNTWREPGDTDAEHSLGRIGFGLLGRMGSNAFDEFWPDAKRKLFHRGTRD